VSEVDPMSGTRLAPFTPAGVSTHPERTLLAERAADYLKGGPASARSLIASVCQLSALPDAVAEHMAVSLLGGHPRFARAPWPAENGRSLAAYLARYGEHGSHLRGLMR